MAQSKKPPSPYGPRVRVRPRNWLRRRPALTVDLRFPSSSQPNATVVISLMVTVAGGLRRHQLVSYRHGWRTGCQQTRRRQSRHRAHDGPGQCPRSDGRRGRRKWRCLDCRWLEQSVAVLSRQSSKGRPHGQGAGLLNRTRCGHRSTLDPQRHVIHVFQSGSIQMITDVSINPAGNVWAPNNWNSLEAGLRREPVPSHLDLGRRLGLHRHLWRSGPSAAAAQLRLSRGGMSA